MASETKGAWTVDKVSKLFGEIKNNVNRVNELMADAPNGEPCLAAIRQIQENAKDIETLHRVLGTFDTPELRREVQHFYGGLATLKRINLVPLDHKTDKERIEHLERRVATLEAQLETCTIAYTINNQLRVWRHAPRCSTVADLRKHLNFNEDRAIVRFHDGKGELKETDRLDSVSHLDVEVLAKSGDCVIA